MKEPKRNTVDLYVVEYRTLRCVVSHTQTKRGKRHYEFIHPPELEYCAKDLTWEQCMEVAQTHYLDTTRLPRRRSKRVRTVKAKARNLSRGNSIGLDKSNFEYFAEASFGDTPTTFDMSKYGREWE